MVDIVEFLPKLWLISLYLLFISHPLDVIGVSGHRLGTAEIESGKHLLLYLLSYLLSLPSLVSIDCSTLNALIDFKLIALVCHFACAEAAVVGVPHDIKGENRYNSTTLSLLILISCWIIFISL